jgi:histidinol-phosphate phosphatase family protein
VKEAGWAAVVITSQRGVGKGLMSRDELDRIHARLQDALGREGVPFLDIYACTHTPEDAHWAKPDPAMILAAAARHHLDVARSIVIGDADRDIQMGRKAGVRWTIRLEGEKPIGVEADHTCRDLLEINELLKSLLKG